MIVPVDTLGTLLALQIGILIFIGVFWFFSDWLDNREAEKHREEYRAIAAAARAAYETNRKCASTRSAWDDAVAEWMAVFDSGREQS